MKHFCILLFLVMFSSGCSKIPSFEGEEILIFALYPNPTGNSLSIHVQNDEKAAYLIEVFDPKADRIFEENVQAGDPKHSFRIDLTKSTKGSYQVILKKNEVVYSKRLLKI